MQFEGVLLTLRVLDPDALHVAPSAPGQQELGGCLRTVETLAVIAAFAQVLFHSEEHLLRIMAGSAIKATYDPSHCHLFNDSTGRPHEVLQRLGIKNIACVHLTDTDGTLGDNGTSKHLPVGDGHSIIAESLRVLREGGFDGWIIMDGWEVPD